MNDTYPLMPWLLGRVAEGGVYHIVKRTSLVLDDHARRRALWGGIETDWEPQCRARSYVTEGYTHHGLILHERTARTVRGNGFRLCRKCSEISVDRLAGVMRQLESMRRADGDHRRDAA